MTDIVTRLLSSGALGFFSALAKLPVDSVNEFRFDFISVTNKCHIHVE